MSYNIIYNTSKHKNTLIIIHGLNQSIDDLKQILDKIKESKRNTKIIIPRAKTMDIFWPNGEIQYKVNSWYNYYSRYDNKFKHDIINEVEFLDSTQLISDIIDYEKKINPNIPISLCGISQGGTIALNYSINSNIRFKSVICIDTIFMHSYEKHKHIYKTPQKINALISIKDEIYNPEFQYYCYNILKKYNFQLNITYRNSGHCENFDYISKFIISKI